MSASAIDWTGETWTPAAGCNKVSPGCGNCCMFRLCPYPRRMGAPGCELAPGMVQLQPGRLQRAVRWREPRPVFVNGMSGAFNGNVADCFIRWMFRTMRAGVARGHTLRLLAKRLDRAAEGTPVHFSGRMPHRASTSARRAAGAADHTSTPAAFAFPTGARGRPPALTGQGRVPRPACRPRQRPRHQRPLREDLGLSPEPQGDTLTEAVESSALLFTKLIARGDPEHLEQALSSARLSRWKRRSVSEGAGSRNSCCRSLLRSQGPAGSKRSKPRRRKREYPLQGKEQ